MTTISSILILSVLVILSFQSVSEAQAPFRTVPFRIGSRQSGDRVIATDSGNRFGLPGGRASIGFRYPRNGGAGSKRVTCVEGRADIRVAGGINFRLTEGSINVNYINVILDVFGSDNVFYQFTAYGI